MVRVSWILEVPGHLSLQKRKGGSFVFSFGPGHQFQAKGKPHSVSCNSLKQEGATALFSE